ncbi:Pyrrolo-quinoline quinone [Planctomycetales bacterium 10988]|nr:Pyrrolo-quinoline quinone [Planctomycetales bacterium 10988]
MRSITASLGLFAGLFLLNSQAIAEDWPRFLGPDAKQASDDADIPLEWGEDKNLEWKLELTGSAGSSSPIIVDQKIFLTSYSGYGLDEIEPGNIESLKRNLLCVDRQKGEILWKKTVDAVLPEDPYRGFITEHGYASNSPVSDGEYVYAFFGKSGVYAYDLDGNEQWHVSVGTESDNREWGTASSLILYKEMLIVTASSESRAIYALNKTNGEEIWKAEASTLDLTFGTPSIVPLEDGSEELVIAVPGEVWGMNPQNGKLKWMAEIVMGGNISPSVFSHENIIYAFGGIRGRGSVAIEAGGQGDVTESKVLWESSLTSYVPTPIYYEGYLYWVNDQGIAHCTDAKTGEEVFRERLPLQGSGGGRAMYGSVIRVKDNIIATTRRSGTYIFKAEPKFEIVAQNRFDDDTDFNATPAIAGDQLFLRSNKALYCISKQAEN